MYFHLGSLYVWEFLCNNPLFCEWELAMNINISENLMQSAGGFCELQKQLSTQRVSLDKDFLTSLQKLSNWRNKATGIALLFCICIRSTDADISNSFIQPKVFSILLII